MHTPQHEPLYRLIDHTADLALHVRGDSLEELFINAATGMFAQMVDMDKVPTSVRRHISVEGADKEALLVAWLSELLYLRETYREAYTRFQVWFPAPDRLEGEAEGGPWQAIDRPIKAVTFHGLKIEQRAGSFEATIVFDV